MKNLLLFALLAGMPCTLAFAQQLFGPAPEFTYQLPQRPAGPLVKDFTGDGLPDFVYLPSLSDKDSLYIHPGLGNGTFASNYRLAVPADFRTDFEVADLNNDTKPDYILSGYWPNGMQVYLSKAGNSYDAGTFYHTGTHGGIVLCTDINQDGKQDILTVTSGSGQMNALHVFTGDGGGNFAKATYTTNMSGKRSIDVLDLNKDNLPDIAVHVSPVMLQVFLQQPDGTFTYQNIQTGDLEKYALSGHLHDVDRDAIPDLVMVRGEATSENYTIAYRKGDGDGGFLPTLHNLYSNVPALTELTLTDLNQDGYSDIIGREVDLNDWDNLYRNRIYTFMGAATGFEQMVVTVPEDVISIVLEDVNQDGKPDLMASAISKKLYVYLNQKGTTGSNGGENPAHITAEVYPNPFTNEAKLAIALKEPGPFTFSLADAQGRVVYTLQDSLNYNSKKVYTLATGPLAPGLYYFAATTKHGRQTGKVVKQ